MASLNLLVDLGRYYFKAFPVLKIAPDDAVVLGDGTVADAVFEVLVKRLGFVVSQEQDLAFVELC